MDMDNWQAVQNWLLFTGVAGGLGLYYWSQSRPAQPAATSNRRRSVQEARPKAKRRATPEQSTSDVKQSTATEPKPKTGDEGTKKKAKNKQQPQQQTAPTVVVQDNEPAEKEVDMSTKQFAQQWAKAKQGTNLSAPKGKDQRLRTVKQSNVGGNPVLSSGSSQAGADADDDMSPAASPAMNAGDVSDMLDPAIKGPSTLRLTASAKPQKERVARQPKEEVVESKKARQNRMKKEQQRLQREAEEKERKALEEKQRRAAREARGEPAKNGMPVSKPPASNAWTAPKSPQPAPENGAPADNATSSAPLLDTFDAESTASSNGASTAATSTTEAESNQRDHDAVSEEEQMATAMKQSEDESGWTTVAVPKKQSKKKQTANGEVAGDTTPVQPTPKPKAAPPVSKSTVNGKPNGFQALNDTYEQRADVDPNDASNWDP